MANKQNLDLLTPLSTPKTITNKKRSPLECLILNDDDDDYADSSTPLRPIFCLKRKSAIKEYDEKEDCFILDFNPDEDALDLNKINDEKGRQNNPEDSPDVRLIAEKGQVACRDYPHFRHLCVKYPFQTTPHESYCKLCYCYVCDVVSPCYSWTVGLGHCHAIEIERWKNLRRLMREIRELKSRKIGLFY
ncbi:RPM1 interacting protein 13-like [Rutidosis leptorrhynchoides]|uniref:RPM1 interacting protein 13-like n=1 Tax=Rutidosis leptorrhynchoides TaxID=125765 RepID=UPI003A99CA32